jgi:hypothetical protein
MKIGKLLKTEGSGEQLPNKHHGGLRTSQPSLPPLLSSPGETNLNVGVFVVFSDTGV